MKDEVDGELRVSLVFGNQARQVALLIKGDDGQKGVSGEGEVLGDPGAAVPMAVFLPNGVVALVMVAIFHAPMPTGGAAKVRRFVGRQAGDEVADVNAGLARWIFFGPPFAPDFHPATRSQQADIHRTDRTHCATADVDATVAAIHA